MNRLIIIGNGFDLAHGLKTSFKNFIDDYICNVINEFYRLDIYEDCLISIEYKSSVCYNSGGLKDCKQALNQLKVLEKDNKINVTYKSALLSNIIHNVKKYNWVDIEREFFKVLIQVQNDSIFKLKNNLSVKSINDDFEFIKQKLFKYLKKQQDDFDKSYYSHELFSSFIELFTGEEILLESIGDGESPSNLYFLNFNYTNIFETYFHQTYDIVTSSFNYIHGSLNKKWGKPIFGFGDESNNDYLKFEKQEDNECFKHIKSFQYMENDNYYNLSRFVQSGVFQVCIYGHSCGISDKTMLSYIFEHINCKSIKIFYYGDEIDNDYTEKTYELSRHFKDKELMRRKVAPLVYCRPMPQPAKECEAKKNGQRSKK